MKNPQYHRGRGALHNPDNRFETIHTEADPTANAGTAIKLPTQYLRDNTQTLITYNDSPDLNMAAGINPYRGCEHGCVYCYARPTHEYLALSAGLDFESRILVKIEAPRILRHELAASKYKPVTLGLSGNTDAYQPAEKKLKITRGCLEVLAEYHNPVAIITKSALVQRDVDVLRELNRFACVQVYISVTTLDRELANVMEPRAASPAKRLDTIAFLQKQGIPVGVMVAPVIPGLTDEEIPAILEASAEAGARSARYVTLRLPYSVKDLFVAWLQQHYPQRESKILNRIRSIRGGNLNDSQFGTRLRGQGIHAKNIQQVFDTYCRRYHLNQKISSLTVAHFRKPNSQMMLFEI